MNVYRSIEEVEYDKKTALTLGTFDGVHIGHKELISCLVETAKSKGLRSFVILYEPHPRLVIFNDADMQLLTTLDEKLDQIEKLGVDNILVMPFTRALAEKSGEDFFREYIIKAIGVSEVILGYDHRFGKSRSGDENLVKRLGEEEGFGLQVVPPKMVGKETVSSTKIRHALSSGMISTAKKMLGRDYTISGKVESGNKLGRTLGFPTANINVSRNKMMPALGVYFVSIEIAEGEYYYGMMNIGYRPTVSNDGRVYMEVHILNYDGELYEDKLKINLLDWIRKEMKFANVEELKAQLERDKQYCLSKLNNTIKN